MEISYEIVVAVPRIRFSKTIYSLGLEFTAIRVNPVLDLGNEF